MRSQSIPERVKHEVLLRSKRRCPLCFAAGKNEPQNGNLVYIDPSSHKDDVDNLVYLCLEHHRELDEGSSLTEHEIREARATLYKAMNVDSLQAKGRRTWHAYEELVVDLVRSAIVKRLGDYFALLKCPLYQGRSGVSHEVDLAIEFNIAGLKYLTVFEIKHRRAKLGADDVLQFAAVTEDIGVNKGVIVSSAGFSTAAVQLARAKGLALLQVPESARRLEETILEDSAAGGLTS